MKNEKTNLSGKTWDALVRILQDLRCGICMRDLELMMEPELAEMIVSRDPAHFTLGPSAETLAAQADQDYREELQSGFYAHSENI